MGSGFALELRYRYPKAFDIYLNTMVVATANEIVKPNAQNSNYTLSFPRTKVEIRNDKSEADSLERILEIFES